MPIRRPPAALLVLTSLALGACAAPPRPGPSPIAASAPETAAPSPEAAVDSLMAAYDRAGSPGAAVLVFRGDQALLSRGYGQPDLEHGDSITPRTIFHVASVSKQFTAFAIALLAAEGRLSLDDDVRTHIPELPDLGQTVTLRHLLHHTSGMRDQWSLWVLGGGRMDDVIRQDDLMRLITRQRELNFAPGTAHTYSNTGYTLLAEVVERVTGEAFGPWMKSHVFDPLGMASTQVYDDHQRIVPGRAYSYTQVDGGFQKAVLSYSNAGATSLFTTTEDLARWLRNLGSARVGGAQVSGMMRTRGVLAGGDTLPYALGIVVDRHRGLEMLSHGGADAGFRSFVSYYPALDAGVVVLGNVASLDAEAVARGAAEAFFAAEMEPAPAAPAGADEPVMTVDSALLARFAGEWDVDGGRVTVRFAPEDGRLFMEQNQRRAELRAVADSVFLLSEADIRFTFHREGDGPVTRATLVQRGRTIPVQRRVPYTPSAAELRAYTGRYYSTELEAVYTVVLTDGALVARHRRHGDVPLAPRRADAFRGGEAWLEMVEFDRDAAGAVTGMRVSNASGRIRNVRFDKLD